VNVFSSEGFLSALAAVNFPGVPYVLEDYQVAARAFRLLRLAHERAPITGWTYLDFVEPLTAAQAGRTHGALPWLPRAALSTHAVSAPPQLAPGLQPSPFIRWSQFKDWAAMEAFIKTRNSGLVADSKRRLRKLAQELGPVQFLLHDARPQVFAACVQLKGAQYRATGLPDLMAQPRNVALFAQLLKTGLLRVSSLSAGETLLAVHFGLEHDGKLYWWVPTYDPAYQRFSPGRLLLEELLRASFAAGHREFDFLIGDETYKWHYATHNRLIGELGLAPLPVQLRRFAKAKGKSVLARYPKAFEAVKALRGRLLG
jgi:hypothetical protein